MNELTDLKALLKERDRIDQEIAVIRDRLREALALIDPTPPAPAPAPPPLPVRDVAPPPLRLANHVQLGEEPCVLYDCHEQALATSPFCAAHAS